MKKFDVFLYTVSYTVTIPYKNITNSTQILWILMSTHGNQFQASHKQRNIVDFLRRLREVEEEASSSSDNTLKVRLEAIRAFVDTYTQIAEDRLPELQKALCEQQQKR